MATALRALGIVSWIGCIVALIYQGVTWVFTASWPSLTLLDVAYTMFGIDLASAIQSLPLNLAIKTTYLLITTELTLALWWAGVFFFALTLGWKVILNK